VGVALILLLAGVVWCDEQQVAVAANWFPGGALPAGCVLGLLGFVVLVPAMAFELTRLLKAGGVDAWPLHFAMPIACGAFAAVCLHAWRADAWARVAMVLVLMGLLPALGSLLRNNAARALADVGRWILFAVWIGAMPACWIALRAQVPWWGVIGAVLAVKCNDIGAYFAGRVCGRDHMVPWLSPQKTWQGFCGGTLASIAAGMWLSMQMGLGWHWGAAYGIAISVLGPFGDLSESLLKRQAEMKDSGATIPGMGGVLDVLDSLLPTAPAALWMLAAAG